MTPPIGALAAAPAHTLHDTTREWLSGMPDWLVTSGDAPIALALDAHGIDQAAPEVEALAATDRATAGPHSVAVLVPGCTSGVAE